MLVTDGVAGPLGFVGADGPGEVGVGSGVVVFCLAGRAVLFFADGGVDFVYLVDFGVAFGDVFEGAGLLAVV